MFMVYNGVFLWARHQVLYSASLASHSCTVYHYSAYTIYCNTGLMCNQKKCRKIIFQSHLSILHGNRNTVNKILKALKLKTLAKYLWL